MSQIFRTFGSVLIRLLPLFEPLIPRYLTSRIRRQLKQQKQKNLILGYKTSSRRKGRFHYQITIDIDLTKEQAEKNLKSMLEKFMTKSLEMAEEVTKWQKRRKAT